MTSDIVERLRAWDSWDPPIGFDERKGHKAPPYVSHAEAADEIERLRSLLKEAGEALEPFANDMTSDLCDCTDCTAKRNARTVLSKIKDYLPPPPSSKKGE